MARKILPVPMRPGLEGLVGAGSQDTVRVPRLLPLLSLFLRCTSLSRSRLLFAPDR